MATNKNHKTLSVSYYHHIKMNCCVLNSNKISHFHFISDSKNKIKYQISTHSIIKLYLGI